MDDNELAGAIHLYQEQTHANIDSVSFPFCSLMLILHFGILINRANFVEAIEELKKVTLDSLPAHQSAIAILASNVHL
jgi:adenosine/AMP kinase